MEIKTKQSSDIFEREPRILAAGAVLAALTATSCCILPVVLFSLGIGGAWIGNFTQLAPYQPIFLAVTVSCVGAGYWLVRRASKRACVDGEACARPLPKKIVTLMLVAASAIAIAAFGFDILAPYLLS